MTTNLWLPFQVQLDASGNGTAEVGAPSLGYNWQAFSTLNPAPSGQTQLVSVSGQVVASGGRQSGPFAAGSMQGVTVAISGGAAGGSVSGVLQGSIQQGTAAQATLPAVGSLIEISGGVIDVSGSQVVITGGQGGNVNVSTDAPPVEGPTLSIAAGASSASYTLHPPPNATAIGLALVPIPTYTLQVAVQDALTLVELANISFPAAGPGVTGRSLTLPLTPGMTDSGIVVTAQAGATLAAAVNFGYSLWYLGTNSFQPVNLPTDPLFTQGQGAAGIAGSAAYPAASLDVATMGLGASVLNSKSQNAIPLDAIVQGLNASGAAAVGLAGTVDMVVRGNQGSSLVSVQTSKEAPYSPGAIAPAIVAAGGTATLVAAVAGKSIRVRKMQLSSSVATQIELLDSATGNAFWTCYQGLAGVFPDIDFEGWPLPSGASLELKNLGGNATAISGHIAYDLY